MNNSKKMDISGASLEGAGARKKTPPLSQREEERKKALIRYRVMQSDGNSLCGDLFMTALTRPLEMKKTI